MTASTTDHPAKTSDQNRVPHLGIWLLLTIGLCLATDLSQWFQAWQGNRAGTANLIAVALGDTRRLFAKSSFVKADVYFHSGYYPTIFDDQSAFHTPHVALYSGAVDQEKGAREAAARGTFLNVVKPDDEGGSPGFGQNWIEEFSQNFHPVRHTHLDQVGRPGEVRELLPWLKLTVELDPHQVDAYVVASYWLRQDLNKIAEAEDFLRQGLHANPHSCEILYELGRIQTEHHHDPARARNLWEHGLKKWDLFEAPLAEPNIFIYAQLLGHLAKLEEEQGDVARALYFLKALERVTPSPSAVRTWMLDLWKKLSADETTHPLPTTLDTK